MKRVFPIATVMLSIHATYLIPQLTFLSRPCLAADATAISRPSFGAHADSILALFDYEMESEIPVNTTTTVAKNGVFISEVDFPSPVAGHVTALLVEPRDRNAGFGVTGKKFAGLVFMHWGQGDKSEFIGEAIVYAKVGAVSLLLDAPWNRPGDWAQAGESIDDADQSKRLYIQTVKDIRRAVDVLLQRNDIDEGHIGYVGHSFGATWGGVLAAADKRISTLVLIGGLPSLTDPRIRGAHRLDAYYKIVTDSFPKEVYEEFVETISPLESLHFIQYSSPASVFMQFGEFDSYISKQAAELYFGSAGKPKRITWYQTGHEFNDIRASLDRAEWLEEKLELGDVRHLLLK